MNPAAPSVRTQSPPGRRPAGSPGQASGTSPRDRRARYRRAGGDHYVSDVMFDADPDEHFYGLGQHQHGLLDQKGAVVELVQRNTEVSVPFALSSRGYGFLWNMPGVGRARERDVYLPEAASWLDAWTGNPVGATGWVTAAAPLERIPVYLREGGGLTDLRGPS